MRELWILLGFFKLSSITIHQLLELNKCVDLLGSSVSLTRTSNSGGLQGNSSTFPKLDLSVSFATNLVNTSILALCSYYGFL